MVELGINLGSLQYVPYEQITNVLEARLLELFKCNQHEWEFYTTQAELLARVKDGRDLLWVAPDTHFPDAFMLATKHIYPSGKTGLVISSAAGLEIVKYLPAMFAAAKKAAELLNCDRVEMAGRDAWARLLSHYGVKTLSRNYILDL